MWKWRKVTIFLMTCLWTSVVFCWDFWKARITAVNAAMFSGCHQSSLCLKFLFTCFAESGLQHMKYTLILTVVQVFSLKSKTILGFFSFDAPSSSCTFFVKIYPYNRVIINSSFNSSFRIPKWWGLQNAKKNCIDFFKQTNCNNPWINATTERKLNLR